MNQPLEPNNQASTRDNEVPNHCTTTCIACYNQYLIPKKWKIKMVHTSSSPICRVTRWAHSSYDHCPRYGRIYPIHCHLRSGWTKYARHTVVSHTWWWYPRIFNWLSRHPKTLDQKMSQRHLTMFTVHWIQFTYMTCLDQRNFLPC